MHDPFRNVIGAVGAGLCALALLAPAPAAAQADPVVVTRDGQTVRVQRDGDYVRVRTPGRDVQVQGDWRSREGRYAGRDAGERIVERGAEPDGEVVRVALSGDILFDFDSAAIRSDASERLAQVAQVIRDASRGDVYVVGHTDAVGEDAYNQRLSEQRAAAVIGWLNLEEGIPASILIGRGLGKSQPVAHNTYPDGSDDPQGRARNRRVEVLLARSEAVDLRRAVEAPAPAGRVEVSDRGIRVEDGAGGQRVQVGGLVVETAGSDVHISRSGAAGRAGDGGRTTGRAGGGTTCSAGQECDFRCPSGACTFRCEEGSSCDATCSGGACRMECASGADCDFSCSGGACRFLCAPGADCEISCTGGVCEQL